MAGNPGEQIQHDESNKGQREHPEIITRGDLAPRELDNGETSIVLQRHGAYVRDVERPQVGSLTPEAADLQADDAYNFFVSQIESTPEAERSKLKILVVASDTDFHEGGKRSTETADLALKAAQKALKQFGLSEDQILNLNTEHNLKGGDESRPMAHLREPQMFNDSPEFVDYLVEKHGGINLDFWIDFEGEHSKDVRETMGAEGPVQIADRLQHSIDMLARYAKAYHARSENRDDRLVIWGGTHYDTISPYVKFNLFNMSPDDPLRVDYGGGINIKLANDGTTDTIIDGKKYPVPVRGRENSNLST